MRPFWAIFEIWAKRLNFGQKVKKADFTKAVGYIDITPKGGYYGTFAPCHRLNTIRKLWKI